MGRMISRQHAARIALLMLGAAFLVNWLTSHAEVTFANGLRHIRESERLVGEASFLDTLRSIPHPLHALAIAAAHTVIGGDGPVSWQRAAQAASLAGLVLLVIPLYLLALELYDPDAAWVACALFFANPMTAYVAANVLSESTFLLFWTWSLWAAACYLREGRFRWLLWTAGLGSLAYLARPEALVLPLALFGTLLASPWHWTTRLARKRWLAGVAFLILGAFLVPGASRFDRGVLGKPPALTQVVNASSPLDAVDLERDRMQMPGLSKAKVYRVGVERMVKALRNAVTIPLIPLVLLGFMLTWPWTSQARAWTLQGFILAISLGWLVSIHVAGGYATVRDALLPGMLLILVAAQGLAGVLRSVVIDGRWFGRAGEFYRPGPLLWGVALVGLTLPTLARTVSPRPDGFAVYRAAGVWIAAHAAEGGDVLDMTDWSLYFSQCPGYTLGRVYEAVHDPQMRWVVLRDAHVKAHWRYSAALQATLEGRQPVVNLPRNPRAGELQVCIYDLRTKPMAAAASSEQPVHR